VSISLHLAAFDKILLSHDECPRNLSMDQRGLWKKKTPDLCS
jgi:hypothetical protein